MANRKCAFINHDEWTGDITFRVINVEKEKRFLKDGITKMRSDGLLGPRAKILCNACSDIRKDTAPSCSRKKSKTETEVCVGQVVHYIQNNELTYRGSIKTH